MIPFNRPSLGQDEEDAVLRVIRSGHLTAGKEVKEFEKEFAEYLGAPFVVAVDNCTNALFLALEYEKIQHGRRYLGCPVMTFASVAHVIYQVGHTLDFTDEYKAGSMYQIRNTNIWDCAHEIQRGMYDKGQVQCFSFYPNKVLASAEGGAIATDNEEFAIWARQAREMGRVRRSFSDYDINFKGWKMNMTDMQAALARVQLTKLDSMLQKRYEIAEKYRQHFKQFNNWHYLFVILVENRQEFMDKMAQQGVEISYHYKPLHKQPAYENFKDQKFEMVDAITGKVVTLPLFPSMTDEEIDQVINLTKQYAILSVV